MNRNPYVPPEQRADYLKSSIGEGACTGQTCHVTEGEKAALADDAGAQDANAAPDEPEPVRPKKTAPAARKKPAPRGKRAAKK